MRLNWLLGAALAAFAASAAIKGFGLRPFRAPHSAFRILPIALLLPIGLLLLLGWGMALNAKAIYDSEFFLFVPLTREWPAGPGSLDQAVSVGMMVRVTLLLGVVMMVANLVRDPRWLLRLWWTVGLAGGSIALLGLMQKASGAGMIFWRETDQPLQTFFATFYYHGNAGAFLNLTLPVTVGLAWRSFRRSRAPVVRALWLTLAVSNVVAAFANTSRMSQALAAGMLFVLAVALVPKVFGLARARFEWPTAVAGTLAICLAIYAVVQTSRVDRALERWDNFSESMPADARWNAAKAAWNAVPEAGWVGFGPGTFAAVFPYFTAGAGENLSGRWIYLHQDYLQTLLEWGWVGSALLGWIFFGGVGVGALGAMRNAKCGMRNAEGEGGRK